MTPGEYLTQVLRDQRFADDDDEMKELRERRAEVEELLRSEFDESSPTIKYGGSMAKGTMIREAYDLDLTCYFPRDDEDAGGTLGDIFENVEAALKKRYQVRPKTSAVRILGTQAGSDFHIDVVPGRFVDGKKSDVFLFRASGDKERLKTNLDVHVSHVKDSGVVDAISLMKLWSNRRSLGIKTFALELVVIKLLKDKAKTALVTQLTHVWKELRDNASSLVIEDPANPEGNELSDLLNAGTKGALSSAARSTLQTIESSGWQAVFGPVEDDEKSEDRVAALRRIAATVPAPPKPHSDSGIPLV